MVRSPISKTIGSMQTFKFTVKTPESIQKSTTNRKVKATDNTPKDVNNIIVKGKVIHLTGVCVVIVDGNQYDVTESSSSLVGKLSYWCHIHEDDSKNAIRIQDSNHAVKEYPHPFRYKWGFNEEVHGYITTNNKFHVTASFNKKFSSRKSRRGF